MIRVLATLDACDCCVSVIANDDESGCRDYWGHDHPRASIPAALVQRLTGQGVEVSTLALVIGGDDDDAVTFVGPCETCGQGPSSYMDGHRVSVLGECSHRSEDDIYVSAAGRIHCLVCGAEGKPDAPEAVSEIGWESAFMITDLEVVRVPDVHVPSAYMDEKADGTYSGPEIDAEGWEPMTGGMSGQYGYGGPVMHPSEFIGRRIVERLARLAVDFDAYGVVAVESVSLSGEQEDEPAGWMIIGRRTTTTTTTNLEN